MTIHTIYQHLITTNVPVDFQLKSTKKIRPNILQLISDQNIPKNSTNLHDMQPEIEINNMTNKEHLSTYILQDEQEQQHYIQYAKTY